MLHNPKWDKKAYNLEGLIAWLAHQPARKRYVYADRHTCMAAQFNQACGRIYALPSFRVTDDRKITYVKGPRDTKFNVVLEKVAMRVPHTYGAALRRTLAVMAK